MAIVIQHMGQDFLSVLESLSHFSVGALESSSERIVTSLSLFVHVDHQFILRAQNDLSLVSEVHLDNLVAQSEHHCMSSLHPLLDIDSSPFVNDLIFFLNNQLKQVLITGISLASASR